VAHARTVVLVVSPLMPSSGRLRRGFSYRFTRTRNLFVTPYPRPSPPEPEPEPFGLPGLPDGPESPLPSILPREAVRGRVRDHPGQAVHPLGRRIRTASTPRRPESSVTDDRIHPDNASGVEDEHFTTPEHEQLELASLVEQVRETVPPERPAGMEKGKWSMSWRPEGDSTTNDSQHPAARVARENAAAAHAQPSIPVTPPSAVEVEAARTPKSTESTETRPVAPVGSSTTAPQEAKEPATIPSSESRRKSGSWRSNPLAAAGWLVAIGLSGIWAVSNMYDTPRASTLSGTAPADVFARPLGDLPTVLPSEEPGGNRSLNARVDELEAEATKLRASLVLGDVELLTLRSAIEEMAATIAIARDDAAYTARERVLLQEELEAALSLLKASDAKN
jgi:hypothetical protein